MTSESPCDVHGNMFYLKKQVLHIVRYSLGIAVVMAVYAGFHTSMVLLFQQRHGWADHGQDTPNTWQGWDSPQQALSSSSVHHHHIYLLSLASFMTTRIEFICSLVFSHVLGFPMMPAMAWQMDSSQFIGDSSGIGDAMWSGKESGLMQLSSQSLSHNVNHS